ncbi:MAG: FAD-dependent oxidoreductase [Pseudomonadota bacterium]
MDHATQNIVIVGGGQAAASASAKLRALGHSGPLTIVSAEPVPPYQRPPLSKKYLMGEMTAERLYLKPESFYAEQAITLRLGTRVEGIDRAAGRIETTAGALPYDALILATGCSPRRLPDSIGGALPAVHLMRDLADADAMAPRFTKGARVLVIGGGYIGLEAAAVAASRGLQVTLVEMAPRILNRVASPETARLMRDLHRGHGVEIREDTGLIRIMEGTASPLAAELTDGARLEIDFAIVGIGIVPEAGLAAAAGLTVNNGIVVDDRCRSSDPAILAAGDCAVFPYENAQIRLESVQNAIDQAEHAAGTIMGADAPYRPVPWFWSDQYDARLQIAGLNRGYDQVIERPGTRPGGASVWYLREGRFIAVDALSEPRAYMQGKRWLENGISPDPAGLADPTQDLRKLT